MLGYKGGLGSSSACLDMKILGIVWGQAQFPRLEYCCKVKSHVVLAQTGRKPQTLRLSLLTQLLPSLFLSVMILSCSSFLVPVFPPEHNLLSFVSGLTYLKFLLCLPHCQFFPPFGCCFEGSFRAGRRENSFHPTHGNSEKWLCFVL